MNFIRRITAMGMALSLGLTGCQFFRSAPPPAKTDALIKNDSDEKPSAAKLVNYLNREADKIQSIRSRNVSFTVSPQGDNYSLDAKIICDKPRRFSLVGRSALGTEVIAGSNEERFWFWIKRDPSNALFHCSYEDFEKGVDLPFPFQPEWVLEVLGMAPVGSADQFVLEEDTLGKDRILRLTEQITFQGQPGKKVISMYRDNATGNTPQVFERAIYDKSGKLITSAKIKEVHRLRSTSGRGDYPTTVTVPKYIVLDYPAFDTKLTLIIADPQVNLPTDPSDFTLPRVGSKTVDLGKNGLPTSRKPPPRRNH